MPAWRGLLARWPHARLGASEGAVGLPPGQMGNSEVGHLNLGAGRPVLQDLPRIDAAIADGSFLERPALVGACDAGRRRAGRLHLISLVGPGGVHANDRHLVAIAELAARRGVREVLVHALLDGRDTPPRSALGFVARPRAAARGGPSGRRGSRRSAAATTPWTATGAGSGRERGYDAIVHGVGSARAERPRPRSRPATPAARTTSSSSPPSIDGVDGPSATATRWSTSTSAPTAPAS